MTLLGLKILDEYMCLTRNSLLLHICICCPYMHVFMEIIVIEVVWQYSIRGERALLKYFVVAMLPGRRSRVRIRFLSQIFMKSNLRFFSSIEKVSNYCIVSRNISKKMRFLFLKEQFLQLMCLLQTGFDPTAPHVLKNWHLATFFFRR